MMYAVLCYNDEKTVWSWSKQEEEAVMTRLEEVRRRRPCTRPKTRHW
jgi:hypothetical protein